MRKYLIALKNNKYHKWLMEHDELYAKTYKDCLIECPPPAPIPRHRRIK